MAVNPFELVFGGGGTGEGGRTVELPGGPVTQAPGSEARSTNYTYDPFQKFLASLLAGRLTSSGGSVSPTVTAGIENMITNPGGVGDIAGANFEKISAPLVNSLIPQEKRETSQLKDLFRKAGVGSMQSGAFAQAGRDLVGDQASRRNQLLASNYVPLSGQLSGNVLDAIRSGINVPQANVASLAGLASAFSKPINTYETGTSLPAVTRF